MPTSAPRKTAARSGNPAKRAEAAPISSAGSFKKKRQAAPVELPSGETVRIQRLELTTLISENLLGDDLGAIAQDRINSGKGITEADKEAFAEDPEKVREMLLIFDRVTIRVWMEPKVLPVPEDEADRDEDQLYVDEIDLADKIFTFNYLSGGDPDLASFRQQFGAALEDLSAGEGVALPAQ